MRVKRKREEKRGKEKEIIRNHTGLLPCPPVVAAGDEFA